MVLLQDMLGCSLVVQSIACVQSHLHLASQTNSRSAIHPLPQVLPVEVVVLSEIKVKP